MTEHPVVIAGGGPLCLRSTPAPGCCSDALGAEITRLDALAAVPAAERARLHEQGVFSGCGSTRSRTQS